MPDLLYDNRVYHVLTLARKTTCQKPGYAQRCPHSILPETEDRVAQEAISHGASDACLACVRRLTERTVMRGGVFDQKFRDAVLVADV